jgi:tetratricopeptide (TPR) repeat protein
MHPSVVLFCLPTSAGEEEIQSSETFDDGELRPAPSILAAKGSRCSNRFRATMQHADLPSDFASGSAWARRLLMACFVSSASSSEVSRSDGAWESYQRGRWYLTRFRSEDLPQAREFLNRALELDPMLAAAHTALGVVFTREGAMHASRPFMEALRPAEEELQKAIELETNDANAHGYRAEVAGCLGDYEAGFGYVERAYPSIRIAP